MKDLLTEEQRDVIRNKGNKIEKLQTDIQNLSKPLLQSNSSWSTHVTPTTLSIFDDEKSWSGIENVDSKRNNNNVRQFQDVTGQSWTQMKDALRVESEDDSYSSEDSPTTTRLDAKDMNIFGAMPLKEDIVVMKCNQCSKPLLASQFKEHAESCKDAKKRKRETEVKEEPDKKKPKKKTLKQKGPIDLDKQCGVIQPPSTTPCTRSITCKNHSMGSKRAVEGRSQPYDVLLAAYQKKSIGRPNGKDQAAVTTTTTTTTTRQQRDIMQEIPMSIPPVVEEPHVDSDEEVENIMQAVYSSRPTPLARKPYYFVKRRRQCFRLQDILLDAITPKSTTTNNTTVPFRQPPSFISLNNTPHFW